METRRVSEGGLSCHFFLAYASGYLHKLQLPLLLRLRVGLLSQTSVAASPSLTRRLPSQTTTRSLILSSADANRIKLNSLSARSRERALGPADLLPPGFCYCDPVFGPVGLREQSNWRRCFQFPAHRYHWNRRACSLGQMGSYFGQVLRRSFGCSGEVRSHCTRW